MRFISKFIFYRLLGWKIQGAYPENIKKFVTIAAPHTHWEDFPLGVLFRSIVNRKIYFLAKASLFKPPFGWFFRWQGGYPVERSQRMNLVDQVVEIFNSKEEFAIALAPEGTRKKVEEWKTGFYYIAKGAGVPIIMVAFDFEHKTFRISDPFYPGENSKEDLKAIRSFYDGIKGRIPEYS
jgi:1-acyl-sn-glycerol-3-phosphate acyltransferase